MSDIAQRYNRKALRSLLYEAVVMVGRINPADTAEAEYALAHLDELLHFFAVSLDFEGRHVALAAARLAAQEDAAAFAVRAGALTRGVRRLRRLGGAAALAQAARRGDYLARLYDGVQRLTGECMAALQDSEARLDARLREACSECERTALQHALLDAMNSAQLRRWLYWMIPVLHGGERVELLLLVGAQLTSERFCRVTKMLEDVLPRQAYRSMLAQVSAIVTDSPCCARC